MYMDNGSTLQLPLEDFRAKNVLSTYINAASGDTFVRSYNKDRNEQIDQSLNDDIARHSLKATTENGNCQNHDDGTDTQSGEENNSDICEYLEKHFMGVRQIQLNKLMEPESDYRVRSVNSERVETLYQTLLESGTKALRSQLTVMQKGDDYTIIDGNHRYRAMLKVRKEELKEDYFSTVSCRVYEAIEPHYVLGLGYSSNSISGDVLKMSDFEVVECLRKIFSSGESKENALGRIYNLLGAHSVSTNSVTTCKV